ncbi:MAG: ribulose-phosphate 3-epimerase [Porphyromonas sp.]|uniref:ribulose-phosphate 3-epimerase n=1 Tax=Porphyromonas sp. TaxID=1924944 RepID=UPI002A91A8D9|nr:ribulose-phosphate 3-epimerase [Porphyromonas sp.]MDD7469003.1 ribulose-phosphate 3-epimerase [Bacteroidales bacterium]MDY6102098.1 ribulose-phosphate 3-epimerase [Porphyromonas sp.]
MKHTIVAPSILSADFLHLGEAIRLVEESEAEWVHCDIMDGHFVPNISYGIPIVKAVRPATKKVVDCHLMIEHPELYVEAFASAGADMITVHQEACVHLDRQVAQIHDLGCKAGVALNPATPVETLVDILHAVDMVLIMSVNPGFGGQKFIPRALDKVRRLRALAPDLLIQVDGGVNAETGAELVAAGADVLVAGSYVFGAKEPREAIHSLYVL